MLIVNSEKMTMGTVRLCLLLDDPLTVARALLIALSSDAAEASPVF